MEDTARIIPTRTKYKISHEYSYPIGAERISRALFHTAQNAKLVLHFKQDYWHATRAGRYPVLGGAYSTLMADWADRNLDAAGIPLFNEWQIEVFSVPKVFRHRIQQHILETGLPELALWLEQNDNLEQGGTSQITFFYDETKETFETEYDKRLQPSLVSKSGRTIEKRPTRAAVTS